MYVYHRVSVMVRLQLTFSQMVIQASCGCPLKEKLFYYFTYVELCLIFMLNIVILHYTS